MRILLDVCRLTFDDLIDFETEVGCSVTEAIDAMAEQRATVEQQKALVWIFTRAGRLRPWDIEWEIPSAPDAEGGD